MDTVDRILSFIDNDNEEETTQGETQETTQETPTETTTENFILLPPYDHTK